MSNAFKCDRCKKFYDPLNEDEKDKRITYRGSDIYGISLLDFYQNGLASFDLCPECVKALDNFMDYPDKEEQDADSD